MYVNLFLCFIPSSLIPLPQHPNPPTPPQKCYSVHADAGGSYKEWHAARSHSSGGSSWYRKDRRGRADHFQPLPQLPWAGMNPHHDCLNKFSKLLVHMLSTKVYIILALDFVCPQFESYPPIYTVYECIWEPYLSTSTVFHTICKCVCGHKWGVLTLSLQRTLLVTHSNQALNQLFEKIMALDIDERHLLRLGHGEEELQTEKDFSRSASCDQYRCSCHTNFQVWSGQLYSGSEAGTSQGSGTSTGNLL